VIFLCVMYHIIVMGKFNTLFINYFLIFHLYIYIYIYIYIILFYFFHFFSHNLFFELKKLAFLKIYNFC
jgi:hypothetical protein